ncbi:MAG TPA: metallophosphoesterase family protein [Bacteroidales bacterium]|nr:metallophosphoesterase family protein [Bacteroidales bacterium]
MKKIGVLSDTHGFLEPRILDFFKDRDEIWHAGDIGNIQTAEHLEQFKPLKAVFGNIDSYDMRLRYKISETFYCEEVLVYITHIGGYPGHYEKEVAASIAEAKPNIVVCGHSHILRVMNDKKYNLLYLNPGAAGNSGFHTVKTALRFDIDGKDIRNMEVFEMKRNANI